MIRTLELMKNEIRDARANFEGTVGNLTQDMLHKDPGGKALPIGAVYAHLVISEDMLVQQMLKGEQPLFDGEWKDRTGLSEIMPSFMTEDWSEKHEKWAKNLSVDLEKFLQYKKAVYQMTDKYLESLKEEDLEREINIPEMGPKNVAYYLYAFLAGHYNSLAGEISALKGMQGHKGYAF